MEATPDDSSTISFSWRQRRTTPPRFRFPGGNAARLLHDSVFLEATPHDSSTISFSWRQRRTTPPRFRFPGGIAGRLLNESRKACNCSPHIIKDADRGKRIGTSAPITFKWAVEMGR